MNPIINGTEFGRITVAGQTYEHDIVIRLDGRVKKRKKKLSKEQYGSSHTVSRAEAEHIHDEGAEQVVVGTGQHGVLKLSDEAREYFEHQGCRVKTAPTPDAIELWNDAPDKTVAMFHVTC